MLDHYLVEVKTICRLCLQHVKRMAAREYVISMEFSRHQPKSNHAIASPSLGMDTQLLTTQTLTGAWLPVGSRRFLNRGRDSSVGIATRYGLEGPGIESQWG
jgi:hypothetical protein